jgi:hypothetical protein
MSLTTSEQRSMARTRNHGYAALAKEDVPDAKRGHPDVDLSDYAAQRGLEILRGGMAAGFRAALPGFEEYRFNVLRGPLPGGCHGLMFHELMEVPHRGSASISGTLHGVYAKTPGRWRIRDFLPDRSDIPIIGELLSVLENPREDTSPPVPFGTESVWIPCTVAATHVPEATLPLHFLRLDRRHHHAPYDFAHHRRLDGFGLPGWHLRADPEPSDELLAQLLEGPLHELLHRRHGRFFQLLVLRGTLIARRGGFAKDAAALDQLAGDLSTAADTIRSACRAQAQPRQFGDPLPAPPDTHDPKAPELSGTPPFWRKAFGKLATQLGLAQEDPIAYHRAFPSLPVPGRAAAVMRGTLPGYAAEGRLAYHCERSPMLTNGMRGAVIVSASESAQPTPPGGVRELDRDLVYDVRDGLLSIWSLRTTTPELAGEHELIARALDLARERNLASA